MAPGTAGENPNVRAKQPRWRLPSNSVLLWFCVAAGGLLAGIGSFTFRYAEGFSYLSTDPKACVNCHIMRSQYDGWQKSSHHTVATCVDCHLPHEFVAKYIAKTENGFRHSKEFTAQTFEEPITIKPRGRQILQENCVTCHSAMVHMLNLGEPEGPGGVDCVHCHSGVGHGEHVGLGGPYRPSELAGSQ